MSLQCHLGTPKQWRRVPSVFPVPCMRKDDSCTRNRVCVFRRDDKQTVGRDEGERTRISSFAKIVTSSFVAYLILQHGEFPFGIPPQHSKEEGESLYFRLLSGSKDCGRRSKIHPCASPWPPSDDIKVGIRAEIRTESNVFLVTLIGRWRDWQEGRLGNHDTPYVEEWKVAVRPCETRSLSSLSLSVSLFLFPGLRGLRHNRLLRRPPSPSPAVRLLRDPVHR